MLVSDLVRELLGSVMTAATVREETEVKESVATWLRDMGYYVADGDRELRDLALEHTSLVDSEGNE